MGDGTLGRASRTPRSCFCSWTSPGLISTAEALQSAAGRGEGSSGWPPLCRRPVAPSPAPDPDGRRLRGPGGDFNVWGDVVMVAEGLADRTPDRATLLSNNTIAGSSRLHPRGVERAWENGILWSGRRSRAASSSSARTSSAVSEAEQPGPTPLS